MSKVTALIDGSAYGRTVIDHAAWAAGRLGTGVDLLHVVASRAGEAEPGAGAAARRSLIRELTEFDPGAEEALRRRAEALLEDGETRLELKGVDGPGLRLRSGDLVDALRAAETEAALLVVGKHGEAGGGSLGSNLERVVRAAARPVLVASRAFQPIRRVTLAYDGGAGARKALAYMTSSPLLRGLEVTLLAAAAGRVGSDEAALAEPTETLRAAGFRVEAKMVERGAKAALRAHVAEDPPDLLAMGAYGHSRFRNLIIGSVTSEALRCCRTPVLLFH